MTHYVQLLGSDTPNGYGGCCYYGPLDHPVLHDSAEASAVGSSWPTGEVPPVLGNIYTVDAEDTSRSPANAIAPAPRLAPSAHADVGGTPHQPSPGEAAESAVSSSSSWSSYLTAKRPTWPRAGPFHRATLLHPQPSEPLVPSSAPNVTADAGSSGNEGYILFNCPEGAQRFSSEANIRLKKVRGFFFTRWSCTTSGSSSPPPNNVVSSAEGKPHRGRPAGPVAGPTDAAPVGAASAVMGLPGMLFTINDAGVRHATFFGPSAAVDGPAQPVRMNIFAPGGARSSAGGSDPRDSNSVDAHVQTCTSSLAGGARANTSTGRPTAAVAGVPLSSPLPSVGLRRFLATLRFHYFQHRPMTFRQLHGVVRSATDHTPACGGHDGTAARSEAAVGNNQVHFLETVGEPAMPRGLTGEGALASSPYIHATLPLSQQSLLVCFRVSGGCRGGESESVTGAAAVSDAMASQPQSTSLSARVDGTRQRHGPCHAHVAVGTEGGKDVDVAASTVAFTAPTSHDVVFGYAVIVSPGPSFDPARARALGVRSGPKYGQLKQGMSVEADVDADMADTPAVSLPPSPNATAPCAHVSPQSSVARRRRVHPHQVMRPTEATRHAYISLVLDGDRPEDVREAVTRLLGSSVDDTWESPARNFAAACEEAEADGETCRRSAVGGHGGGALQRLLLEHFPHLAYYHEGGDGAAEETVAAPNPSQAPRLSRRPRQLVVRHAFHVQPAAYFADVERRWRHDMLPHSSAAREDRVRAPSNLLPPLPVSSWAECEAATPSIYAAYNAYVFADVAVERHPLHHHQRVCGTGHHGEEGAVEERVESGGGATMTAKTSAPRRQDCCSSLPAVQLSLAPSLSFTLHDMFDGADEDARAGEDGERDGGSVEVGEARQSPPTTRRPQRTWHLFTSYVQQHYTAFPTALVHRYHLSHLAPSLFPILGATAVPQRVCDVGEVAEGCAAGGGAGGEAAVSVEASGSSGAARTQRTSPSAQDWNSTSADDSVGYWPYSLKLRCIPEAALQLPHQGRGLKRKTDHAQQGAATALSASATAKASSVHGTVAAEAASPSPLSTFRKRARQTSLSYDTATVPACSGACSSAAAAAASSRARPPAACTQPPSAPSRHLAVMEGATSLLPYPTPASALALLSAAFLRSLETSSAVAAATAAGEAPATTLTPAVGRVDTHDSFAASPEHVGMRSTGLAGIGGGAVGFLGTGSAVPSKYRNVSGTFLELHLPAYCFPREDGPAQPLPHEDAGVDAPVAAAVVSEDTPSAPRGRPPAGEAAGARRDGDVSFGSRSTDFVGRSRDSATTDAGGSQTTGSPPSSWRPPATCTQRLRRGVVILDFGEGSAGQLASLCGRVRSGGACLQRQPRCHVPKSPLCGTCGSHPESSRDRREDANDHGEDTESSTSSAHPSCAAAFTEPGDAADARLAQFVLDIVLVFISHAHADHHLGLMSLLTLRHQYLQRGSCAVPPARKLLIVCPAEVYAFMMDAWGGTAPYTTWLQEECVFELMPPPASVLRKGGLLSTASAEEEGSVVSDGCQGRCRASTAAPNNSRHDCADGAERDNHALGDDDVGFPRATSFTHRCGHHRTAPRVCSSQPEEQHVVPMPLLQAHLTAWNRAIATGIQHQLRHPSSDTPLLSSSEPPANASLAAARCVDGDGAAVSATAVTAALARDDVWWDAEVVTVDHPANAHALLLRFPFCSSTKTVQGEAAGGAEGRAAKRDAAEAATGQLYGAEPLSCIPDSSRVLLFSGDTRPSSFLVERSWNFAARARRRPPRCGNPTELVAQGGLLMDGAGVGSTAGGAVGATLVKDVCGSGSAGRAPAAAAVARSPAPQPSSPSSSSSSSSPPVFVLVHEATFGPGFEEEAARKKHSTLPEALRIGAAVRAEFVVLNHFSQRYPKLPGLTKEQLGGRSTALVCQRRTRATAAVVADGEGAVDPLDLPGGGVASKGSPGPRCPSEQERLTGNAASAAPREDGNGSKGKGDAELAGPPLPPPPADAHQSAESPYANVSFAFDLMIVSFADMQRGLVSRLTPTLVRLLEEYDSWGVGTTRRMRGGVGVGGGGAGRCPQKQLRQKPSAALPAPATRGPAFTDGEESEGRLTSSRLG
ncbi:hypothetical protein LSCM1_07213 [Leishmania martiniquensis]|uniref:ribonuclease Z n=1 Tax=Leishmania martiniquensis TaxID=1580590 RepID=A0A836HZN4_9TRYP|nr:hypothetical protein LSCM1_07213 [Leishmania martiniquensis]